MSQPLPWTQQVLDRRWAGMHRIKVTPPGGAAVDVTYFRDIPTQVNSYAFSDPFGPSTAEIAFPQISVFDTLGSGELSWLVPEANIDIYWQAVDDPTDLDIDDPPDKGSLITLWEGYIASLAYSAGDDSSAVSVQCKGALFQADNYKAYPQYPPTPIPYELLIRDGLDPKTHPSLRTAKTTVSFPANWTTKVPDPAAEPAYLRPYGVKKGDNWTGLTTRSTGSWNSMLTGFIQGLLSLMYTKDGSQWTVMLNPGRRPELRVRQIMHAPDDNTLEVWATQPGVSLSLTEDWTQVANVYYGTGTDTSGVQFSNASVNTDGSRTSYAPFAAMRQVHPATNATNKWFDHGMMRHETQVNFDQGISPAAAAAVALNQLQRSAHPGHTGSVTVKVDLTQNGETFSRFKIKTGMQILVHGFKGMPAGLLLHIAQVQVNVNDASVELTVDSKFRDLLTIQQVQARSRDALSTLRALKVGAFSPVIQDLRKPWSYAHGSGVIPSSPAGADPNGTSLFTKYASGSDVFPWTTLTRKYPPRTHPHWYASTYKARSDKFDNNWATTKDGYGVPCLFAEDGTIRLFQFAAYDADGNVMPIRFHVSFYTASGIGMTSMPKIPGASDSPGYLASLKSHAGQRYPFFPGAFETVDANGAPKGPTDNTQKDQSFVVGWGNYYQGAGYYPGLQTEGGKPTGMLVDESTWTFSTTQDPNFQQRPNKSFPQNLNAGLLFVMIYGESIIPKQPVYFLGRCFRQEPGSS